MTIKVGAAGGSPWSFPQMPFPLNGEGLITNDANIIPHKGTLIDGVEIPFTSGGNIVGLLGGSVVWTVTPGNVNVNVGSYLGLNSFWYDSVNDKLYLFGVETIPDPDVIYTAFITLETGAVTNVGNIQMGGQPDTTLNSQGGAALSRPAIDSGNFTFKMKDRTIVFDESDGSEVSNVASTNTTENNLPGNYTTLDGTISLNKIVNASTTNTKIEVTRGKNTVFVPMPNAMFVTTASTLAAIAWGDKVKLIAVSGDVNKILVRTFLRADFDAWLVLVADFGGLA